MSSWSFPQRFWLGNLFSGGCYTAPGYQQFRNEGTADDFANYLSWKDFCLYLFGCKDESMAIFGLSGASILSKRYQKLTRNEFCLYKTGEDAVKKSEMSIYLTTLGRFNIPWETWNWWIVFWLPEIPNNQLFFCQFWRLGPLVSPTIGALPGPKESITVEQLDRWARSMSRQMANAFEVTSLGILLRFADEILASISNRLQNESLPGPKSTHITSTIHLYSLDGWIRISWYA